MNVELFEGFFSDGAEFWIGKVVDIEAQKTSAQGFSWGWRYKVRILAHTQIVIISKIKIATQRW